MSAPRELCEKCGDMVQGRWVNYKGLWTFVCACGYEWGREWRKSDRDGGQMNEHKEIECAMNEIIGTDEEPGISGHSYVVLERYESGCGVEVLKCEVCGHVTVGWWKSDSPPVKVKDGDPMPDVCMECGTPWPKHKDYCPKRPPAQGG